MDTKNSTSVEEFIQKAFKLKHTASEIDRFYDALDYLGTDMELGARRLLLVNARNYIETLVADADALHAELQAAMPEVLSQSKSTGGNTEPAPGHLGNLADHLEPEHSTTELSSEAVEAAQEDTAGAISEWDEEEPATSDILQVLESEDGANVLNWADAAAEFSEEADSEDEQEESEVAAAEDEPGADDTEEDLSVDSMMSQFEEPQHSPSLVEAANQIGGGDISDDSIEEINEQDVLDIMSETTSQSGTTDGATVSTRDSYDDVNDTWGGHVSELSGIGSASYGNGLEQELKSLLSTTGSQEPVDEEDLSKKTLVGIGRADSTDIALTAEEKSLD